MKEQIEKYKRFCSVCGSEMNFIITDGRAFGYWSLSDGRPVSRKDYMDFEEFDRFTGEKFEYIEYKCPKQEIKSGWFRGGINEHDYYSIRKDKIRGEKSS